MKCGFLSLSAQPRVYSTEIAIRYRLASTPSAISQSCEDRWSIGRCSRQGDLGSLLPPIQPCLYGSTRECRTVHFHEHGQLGNPATLLFTCMI
jgi:hypothetical protein